MKELFEIHKISDIDKVINKACKLDMEVQQIEGSLLDEYVIHTNGNRFFKGIKKYKYLILKEVFINSWSSATVVCGTDSEKKVTSFLKSRGIIEV